MKNHHKEIELFTKWGLLLQPIEECLGNDAPKNPIEFRIAIARSQVGDAEWRQSVAKLSTFPGNVVFKKENSEISHIPERLRRELGSLIEDPNLISNLEDLRDRALVVVDDNSSSLDEKKSLTQVERLSLFLLTINHVVMRGNHNGYTD